MNPRFSCAVLFACVIAVAVAHPRAVKEWPECPNPDGYDSVYFPDMNDCRFFYQCSNGQPIHIMCAYGTVFNSTINVCVHPTEESCIPAK